MIPSSVIFDQSTLARMLAYDPVVQDYQAFFALLEWPLVEQWQAQHSMRGRPAHPESAYLKACLIRIREGFASTTQLRHFLVKHPLLVIELRAFTCTWIPISPMASMSGTPFRMSFLAASETPPAAIPICCKHSCRPRCAPCKPRLSAWAKWTASDVKQIYAWVRENNPRVYTQGRF